MAASPQFKIYDEFKDYLGCFHDIYDAGSFCLNCGRSGFTIRKGHRIKDIIWTEPEMHDDDEEMPIWERKRLFDDMARHHRPKGGGMSLVAAFRKE